MRNSTDLNNMENAEHHDLKSHELQNMQQSLAAKNIEKDENADKMECAA